LGIAFTVTVGESDWRGDLSGWNCSALAIPGAALEEVYAQDAKVDSACYEALGDLNLIRWRHGTRAPKKAIVTIRLKKELSTQELTLRWRKLAIVLPVLATLVLGSLTYVLPKPSQGDAAGISPWTIKGTVMRTGEFEATEVSTYIMPPDLRLKPDFTFSGQMPLLTTGSGTLQLPDVIFDIKHNPGFVAPVVHMANPGERLPPGAEDYNLEIDYRKKTIEIRRPIEIRRGDRLVPESTPYMETGLNTLLQPPAVEP